MTTKEPRHASSATSTQEVKTVQATQQESKQPYLLFLNGEYMGRPFPLLFGGAPIRVGREEEFELQIESPEVSRQHALLTEQNETITLEDLNSRNGTFINGKRIQEATALKPGDKIKFGPYLTLRFDEQERSEVSYHQHMHQNVTHDPITGAINRRFFYECLGREWAFAKRHKQSISVLLLDIDQFRTVNEKLGHANGDLVLQEVAQRIHDQIRQEDLFARYAGEEFTILFRNIDPIGTDIAANRIRAMISSEPFEMKKEKINITVSIGAVTYTAEELQDRNVQDMLDLAEVCLEKAKNAGCDRVRSASPVERK